MVPYWFNQLVAVTTLSAEVGLVVLGGLWLFRNKLPPVRELFAWLATGWWALVVAAWSALAILVSLFYESVGYAPCFLCWLARVFFYPLPLMLVVGWVRGEVDRLAPYVLAFSAVGMGVTLYQHLLQMGVASSGVCRAGGAIDCAERWFFELGHITFPWVGLVMLAWFTFLAWVALAHQPRDQSTEYAAR